VPGVTAVMAWLLLGEHLSPLAVAGLALASVGCWLVSASRGSTRKRDSARWRNGPATS